MTLKKFKNEILALHPDTKMVFSISDPFSWRGSYDEVCFSIIDEPTSAKDILNKIEEAYNSDGFEGWKGGAYDYYDYTRVNFEASQGDYTAGDYCTKKIEEYSQEDYEPDPGLKLIGLMTGVKECKQNK